MSYRDLVPGTPEYRAWYREYYKANKESIRSRRRAHYHANKELYKRWNAVSNARHPDRIAARHKRYYEANKPRIKRVQIDGRFKREYGITFDRFSEMVIEQLGCCYMCKSPCYNLGVDHNHKTNEVRKLLCSTCNQALGLLKENPELCEVAARYLREHDNANGK